MDKMITIRNAVESDAKALLDIYAPYVENTAITFEYTVPTEAEFQSRIKKVQKRYPYLVAEYDNKIVGYAYASAFHERAAYDWCVETSIYMEKTFRRSGVGSGLYQTLEAYLRQQGILNMYACIAYPETEDEYLTWDSVRFHEKMGFKQTGMFKQSGYKFNRWYNSLWMEKMLGVHSNDVKPEWVKKYSEIAN